MSNNIFGDQDPRTGAKIVSQTEWNELNNSIQNINLGDNNAIISEVSPQGIQLGYDSFFFPHVAAISGDYQTAIIGWDREEDFYPYIDYVTVNTTSYLIDADGFLRTIDDVDVFNTSYNVIFPTKNSAIPTKPGNPNNGIVVGYQWTLEPQAIFAPNETTLDLENLFISYKPKSNFDDEIENGSGEIYSEEYVTSGIDAWSILNGEGSTKFSISEAINNGIESHPILSAQFPYSSGNDAIDNNKFFNERIIKLPIARYDWNASQTELTRCVQLFFGHAVGGSAGSSPFPSDFRHPFKGYILSGDLITIGPDRPDAEYEFKDTITIIDPDTDLHTEIAYTEEERVALSGDSYVYYELYKNGSLWESEIKSTDTWPPTETFAGNYLQQIGYGTGYQTSGGFVVSGWGQHMFECPTIHAADIRGEFEPWYETSGDVTIAAGTVESFNNTQTIPESTWPLQGSYDLFITATSSDSSDEPSVSIASNVTSGSYPGKIVDNGDSVDFNYLIGSVAGGVYTPAQKGRLNIDTTLLEPSIDSRFCEDDNAPRVIALSDDFHTTVGDNTNDMLLSGQPFQLDIEGGTVKSMKENVNDMKWYGLTEDQTGIEFNELDGINGANLGEGEFIVSGTQMDKKWDRGLVQTHDLTIGNTLRVKAGDNIKIQWSEPTATINAGFDTVSATVVTDAQLLSGGTLQIKTKTIEILNQSAESGWTNAGSLATTECP